jgi:predicted GNAT superfamily acetyltransferase
MPIRPFQPKDLAALYAINQASTPGVGHEDDAAGLGALFDMGTCLVATDEADTPLGFINLVEPGTLAYASENLRWLERWMAEHDTTMLYVDRIAIAEAARGQRTGQRLYEAAFALTRERQRQWLTCEVNTDPDNPGSHRFHSRLGFVRIGAARFKPDYAVAFYARGIDG